MAKTFFYIIFVMYLSLQPLSNARAGVVERNDFLTQVLTLAQKPRPFFIIDLGTNKINLMARGIAIREWTINRVVYKGEPVPVKSFVLEKKNIQLQDLRSIISTDGSVVNNITTNKTVDTKNKDNKEVDKTKEKKFEVVAMEIDDMPSNYILFLNDGISINVRTQSDGFDNLTKRTLNILKEYVYSPVMEIWTSISHKKTSTEFDFFFKDKTEAQALFWAFTDQTECIVIPPGSVNNKEDFQL
jgi:hypothetical protein